MSESKFYLLKESLIESVIADCISFGFLVGSVWFNQKFCGESSFLNAVILVMFLLFSYTKVMSRSRIFKSREELINYLKSQLHKA